MCTAIIEVSNNQFNVEVIKSKNNADRIKWINNVLSDSPSIEYYRIFETIDDFIEEVNEHGISADCTYITIDYTEWTGSKFIYHKCDDIYNISARFCVTCKTGVYNGDTRINAAKSIRDYAFRQFGEYIKCQIWGYYNADDDYRYDVYITGEKCMILNNIRWFCQRIDDDVKIADRCELEWSFDGSDINQVTCEGDDQCYYDSEHEEDELIEFIGECASSESQKTQEDSAPQQKVIESESTPKKPDNKYGRREFTEHAQRIFEDGHAIFLTQVNGKMYIVNGLFDNEDLIAHVYDEESMTLLKRVFWIGAQDGVDSESEYLADWFEETFVKDNYWNDSWYMTDKQFDFLKNA